ncbi:MAG: GNAT family N-acetyltransferase [Hymenobacteraceae bacterium]|nr:GNAT family N-acetyltransferase [Hymenobacteraceae bacterium]MDX5396625.1 GNAT family N-acetyltransferase [Hymenobacteraceae bacterium]MDX5512687.1 GNAT family N-acetyltransferase [Hymenobacteraceae bacterium]
MLKHLQHHEIDRQKWDACVAASAERMVYAFSWYLDVVCQKQWEGLVEEQEGIYTAVLPLPVKKRFWLKQVYQPFFTQQLGLFQTSKSKANLEAFLKQIPQNYLKIYLQLNTKNILSGAVPSFTIQKRINYHLPLNKPYQQLYQSYATNQKRNLKKAKTAGLLIAPATDIGTIINLFRENKGKELQEVKPKHYKVLQQLYHTAKKHQAAALWQVTQNNKLLAAAFFLVQSGKIIFLFGASSEAGKKAGAMAFLLDSVIQQHAGQNLVLDFEGSNVPGVAKFYANFGAAPVTYLSLSREKLPWYIKWISRSFIF